MATLNAVQAMLLEESVLFLLGTSGYRPVTAVRNDPTLTQGSNGLNVTGRGEKHQIDAIGDFLAPPPFSHPQRLLLEAKWHAKKQKKQESTGIGVIRNAVGVLKDVSEFWVTAPAHPLKLGRGATSLWPVTRQRYHYQYAVISSTGFSEPAERYAFAQDIFLIQVSRSRYFAPVLATIGSLTTATFGAQSASNIEVDLGALRAEFRQALSDRDSDWLLPNRSPLAGEAREGLNLVVRACHAIQPGLLAVTPTGCPILMVANPEQRQVVRQIVSAQDRLNNGLVGEIGWDADTGGFIVHAFEHDALSFDIPPHLFNMALNQLGLLAFDSQSDEVIIEVLFTDRDGWTGNPDALRRHTATLIPMRLSRAELDKFRANRQRE